MKNPWMSMWLSAANRAAGPARGAFAAEAKRQQAAFLKGATQAALGAPAKKKRASPKRRAK